MMEACRDSSTSLDTPSGVGQSCERLAGTSLARFYGSAAADVGRNVCWSETASSRVYQSPAGRAWRRDSVRMCVMATVEM